MKALMSLIFSSQKPKLFSVVLTMFSDGLLLLSVPTEAPPTPILCLHSSSIDSWVLALSSRTKAPSFLVGVLVLGALSCRSSHLSSSSTPPPPLSSVVGDKRLVGWDHRDAVLILGRLALLLGASPLTARAVPPPRADRSPCRVGAVVSVTDEGTAGGASAARGGVGVGRKPSSLLK